MQRRTLFKLGLAGAAVLAVGGGMLALVRPGWSAGRLTPAGRELFSAVARAVLDGVLPAPGAARDAALAAHLGRVEDTINGLPPSTQGEIAQLMGLLGHPLGRRALAGLASPWAEASVAELQQSLQGLRESSSASRQQVYHALRDLSNGAYFSERSTWGPLGYPGPRDI